jgi:hypothetical protein
MYFENFKFKKMKKIMLLLMAVLLTTSISFANDGKNAFKKESELKLLAPPDFNYAKFGWTKEKYQQILAKNKAVLEAARKKILQQINPTLNLTIEGKQVLQVEITVKNNTAFDLKTSKTFKALVVVVDPPGEGGCFYQQMWVNNELQSISTDCQPMTFCMCGDNVPTYSGSWQMGANHTMPMGFCAGAIWDHLGIFGPIC